MGQPVLNRDGQRLLSAGMWCQISYHPSHARTVRSNVEFILNYFLRLPGTAAVSMMGQCSGGLPRPPGHGLGAATNCPENARIGLHGHRTVRWDFS